MNQRQKQIAVIAKNSPLPLPAGTQQKQTIPLDAAWVQRCYDLSKVVVALRDLAQWRVASLEDMWTGNTQDYSYTTIHSMLRHSYVSIITVIANYDRNTEHDNKQTKWRQNQGHWLPLVKKVPSISHVCVATYLRCGRISNNDFITTKNYYFDTTRHFYLNASVTTRPSSEKHAQFFFRFLPRQRIGVARNRSYM